MNKPHVEKLHYKMILKGNVDYKNASPVSDENDIFKMTASVDDGVTFNMKKHFDTEHDARQFTDRYLEKWRIFIGLKTDPDEITFAYDHAHIVDLDPESNKSSTGSVLNGRIRIIDSVSSNVSRYKYTDPKKDFSISPDVETMYYRYRDYREGKEKLLSMSYLILTILEMKAENSRGKASRQFNISKTILDRLGRFCSAKGDRNDVRKATKSGKFEPLTSQETNWVETVCKMMIERVGEYEYCSDNLQQITMADLPPLD